LRSPGRPAAPRARSPADQFDRDVGAIGERRQPQLGNVPDVRDILGKSGRAAHRAGQPEQQPAFHLLLHQIRIDHPSAIDRGDQPLDLDSAVAGELRLGKHRNV
jgi:hypothetical protein